MLEITYIKNSIFREKVVKMFHHAYDGYIEYAYPYDELRPLTCDGHDTWGRYVYCKWSDIILTSVYDRHLFVIVQYTMIIWSIYICIEQIKIFTNIKVS